MSDSRAKNLGYTHRGRLEGFPVYIQFNGSGPNVAGKWWFIDLFIDFGIVGLIQRCRSFLQSILDRGMCTPESSCFLFSELHEL